MSHAGFGDARKRKRTVIICSCYGDIDVMSELQINSTPLPRVKRVCKFRGCILLEKDETRDPLFEIATIGNLRWRQPSAGDIRYFLFSLRFRYEVINLELGLGA